jgi:hypothetical protein
MVGERGAFFVVFRGNCCLDYSSAVNLESKENKKVIQVRRTQYFDPVVKT